MSRNEVHTGWYNVRSYMFVFRKDLELHDKINTFLNTQYIVNDYRVQKCQ